MSVIIQRKHLFIACGISAWGALGAYRGVQKYNKEYKKDYERYLICKTRKPTYYYTSCIGKSIEYVLVYFLLFPGSVVDEMYKFEEFIRGIRPEDE